jgi:hypothetical protein
MASLKPALVVVGTEIVGPVGDLFGRRGFNVRGVACAESLGKFLRTQPKIGAAVVDFALPDALAAAQLLGGLDPVPVIVGISPLGQPPPQSALLDAGFTRPVDPARLFARVVILIGDRKSTRHRRITGVIAVVNGNTLFKAVEKQLWACVNPVNAGAVLEKVLGQLDIDPQRVTVADFAAAIASGRLAAQLAPFGKREAIAEVLHEIEALLEKVAA